MACALAHDAALLPAFLRWCGVEPPKNARLRVAEQAVPGQYVPGDEEEAERRGLPDLVVDNGNGWAAIFEAKFQARLTCDQIRRHRRTAERCGVEDVRLVALVVQRTGAEPAAIEVREWREFYGWLAARPNKSFFVRELLGYMRVLERRMIAAEYHTRGTLTMFDGLRFDDEEPFTYAEAKRRIRLLGDILQERKDLVALGVDPKGARRSAITGRDAARVWDFLPLKAARGSKYFTGYPHLTMALHEDEAQAAVTVPNGVRGGFRTRLRSIGVDGFGQIMLDIERNMRPLVKRSAGAEPRIYAIQRRYASQRSEPRVIARINADIRTYVPGAVGGVKYQPQWIESVYELLTEKKSNIQFGVYLKLDYSCETVRSPKVADLFADAWKGCAPLLDFVLDA